MSERHGAHRAHRADGADRSRAREAAVALALLICSALTPSELRAQEFPESPDDPSAFVTVIEARDYDERFESVEDVLEQVAGVRIRRFGALGSFSTATLRGAKSEQVVVLLDGVRINSGQRGAVDLSTLSLRATGRIEVLRGAGAARYGSDAVGGVISITTRGALESGVDGSVSSGQLGTLGADGVFSWVGDRKRASFGYTRLRSDNDFRFTRLPGSVTSSPLVRDRGAASLAPTSVRNTRRGADFLSETYFANLTYEPAENTELVATLNWHQGVRGQPGSTAGALSGDPDSVVSCTRAQERVSRGVATVELRRSDLPLGSLGVSLFHRYNRYGLHDKDFACSFLGDPRLPPEDREDRVQSIDTSTGVDLVFAGRSWGSDGVRLQNRSAVTVRAERLRGDDTDGVKRRVLNAFLQEEIGFFSNRLRLVPALGLDFARTDPIRSTRLPGSGRRVSQSARRDGRWLPRIGAIVRMAPGVQLRANYARTFRRPNFTELYQPDLGFLRGNPELEPEEAWNFDVGLQWEAAGARWLSDWRAELVYFHQDLDDPIEYVALTSRVIQPQNLGPSRIRGYEAQVGFRLFRRVDLSGSYTYLDAEMRRAGGGVTELEKRLPQRPRNSFFVRAQYRSGPFLLVGKARYEDDIFFNDAGNLGADEVVQYDLGLSVTPSELPGLAWLPQGVTLSADWVNLTDQDRTDSLGLPLPGRLFAFKIRGTF